jgi:hypothetical protein
MNQPAAHPATQPFDEHTADAHPHPSPTFYWELTPDEQQHLVDQGHAFLEEGYLAIDINHGRRLVAIPCPWEDWPPVETRHEPLDLDRYADNIACILQAAQWDGYDLQHVIERALYTQALTYDTSAAYAARR